MKIYPGMTYDLIEDKDDEICVTTHEEIDGTMSIHGSNGYGGFAIHIRQEQAQNLVETLRKKLLKIRKLKAVKQ